MLSEANLFETSAKADPFSAKEICRMWRQTNAEGRLAIEAMIAEQGRDNEFLKRDLYRDGNLVLIRKATDADWVPGASVTMRRDDREFFAGVCDAAQALRSVGL